ncbi:MAG: hypothetical protein Q8P35_02710 [Candidatus Yanofskybacteria bacterium]|nr:hypothetical protein [Candidatus Yanofskybacteria bacterium]
MAQRKFLISLIVITLTASAGIASYLIGHPNSLSGGSATILDKFTDNPAIGKSIELTQKRRLTAISQQNAVSPAISANRNKVLYYEAAIGRVFETDIEGRGEVTISENKLSGFIRTFWSPNKREVISEFRNSSGIQFRYYNYETNRTATLPQNIRSLTFSPDGQEIAYFQTKGEMGMVYLALPDGSNPKKIFDTRILDIKLLWPSAQQIIIQTSQNSISNILILSPEGGIARILSEQKSLRHVWSPSGNKVLFSTLSSDNISSLSVLDIMTRSQTAIGLKTSADKCVWSIDERTVICAVAKSTTVSEDIFKIDVSSMRQELLFTGDLNSPPISAEDLFLMPGENYLIFLNAIDDRLYSLKI